MAQQRVMLKAVLLGDAGVGKTALLGRFVHRKFAAMYKATIGADFLTKEVEVRGQNSMSGPLNSTSEDAAPVVTRRATLQLWDTAGQERFQSLGTSFYRGSDCCLLVFDIGILESFQDLELWHKEFLLQAGIPLAEASSFPFVVLGNKCDIDPADRAVTTRQAEEWCRSHGNIPYRETSAKEDTNVEAAFQLAAELAMRHRPQDGPSIPGFDGAQPVDLGRSRAADQESCAC